MRDIYQRPSEEQSAGIEDRLRRRFPSLVYDRFEWIGNPGMRLIIDDVSSRFEDPDTIRTINGYVENMINAVNQNIRVYPITALSKKLADLMIREVASYNPATTAVIYPGEGAETVRRTIPKDTLEKFPSVVVPARRVKDAKTREVSGIDLSWDIQQLYESLGGDVETVIVLDDVIDSGRTLTSIRAKGAYTTSCWIAGTPIMFSPLPYKGKNDIPSSVPRYDKVFASIVLQGKKNPVPLNSLSSYVEGTEKSADLILACVYNYIDNVGDFAEFVSSIMRILRILDTMKQQ